MSSMPPVLRAEDLRAPVLADIRAAVQTYHGEYGYTEAFDTLMRTRSDALLGLLKGTSSAARCFRCIRDELLAKWGSARSLTEANCPAIVTGFAKAASLLAKIPDHVQIDTASDEHLELIVRAFEELDNCKGVGATIASKILGALRPGVAMIWDAPIAGAYGFAHTAEGYRRFLHLMREVGKRLRKLSTDRDLARELVPADRPWKPPLAKLIDEWHWIRITRGTRN